MVEKVRRLGGRVGQDGEGGPDRDVLMLYTRLVHIVIICYEYLFLVRSFPLSFFSFDFAQRNCVFPAFQSLALHKRDLAVCTIACCKLMSLMILTCRK